jgi:hypothetical protein
MLGRLLRRATVVGIDGPSYRLRHHQTAAVRTRRGLVADLFEGVAHVV